MYKLNDFLFFNRFSYKICFRGKRIKPIDDGIWDCSVCTYKNSAEAFKCAMCDVRKGTSTRFLIIERDFLCFVVSPYSSAGRPLD